MENLAPSTPVQSFAVPEGTRLVHIGPHKTGTSALQGAFHLARASLAEQGVHYAGRTRQPLRAVHAVTDRSWHSGDRPSMRLWRELVREVRTSTARRVVVSSEGFADADPEAIPGILEDLDLPRVHIVVTLRPLARIMPSQWQQAVQGGLANPYHSWLRHSFLNPRGEENQFWRRHRHDRLVARWADVVGPANLTVVVVDERDPTLVLRAFEHLVALREGTLVQEQTLANRSMTLPEVEAVRAFNAAFKADNLPMTLHAEVMRVGAARLMKQGVPSGDWPRLETPQWALDYAAGIEREMVGNIASSGVRVMGDLERLAEVQTSGLDGDEVPAIQIPPEVAGSLAISVLHAMRDGHGERTPSESAVLEGIPTRRLARAIVRRAGRATVGRLRRPAAKPD